MIDEGPRHPEVDVMTAFIEGTLGPAETAEVAKHLASCDDCRLVVTETARFEREEVRRSSSNRRRMWWIAAAAAAVIVATMSIPIVQNLQRRNAPVAILIDAAPRDHRVVEPRLSGFPWARLQAPARGRVEPLPSDLKFAGAAGEVLERTKGLSDAHARHAAGVAQLLTGQSGVAALAEAAEGSKDAAVWNDLAAARTIAGKADASQLPLALGAADHALRLDPNHAEALFNRALILEQMNLHAPARTTWERYLDVDPSSPWSVEAREHLHRLAKPSAQLPEALQHEGANRAALEALVRDDPQTARAWAEGVLPSQWAGALEHGDAAHARERLETARTLAEALAATKGELLAHDAISAIDRGAPELIEAYSLYREARIALAKRASADAQEQFARAAQLFRRGGSPMAEVADYYAAAARGDRDALAALLSKVDATRHRALAAQLLWELAVRDSNAGHWGATIRNADAASQIFTALGETRNAAFLETVAAYALERVGANDLAWKRLLRSLPRADSYRRNVTLHAAALGLEANDRIDAARSVLDVMIDGAPRDNNVLLSLALADRARLATRAGDAALAHRAIADARNAAQHIPDRQLREMTLVKTDLAEAALDAHPSRAAFDRAIAYFAAHGAENLLPDAYLQRARAFRSTEDYDTALREIEKQQHGARDAGPVFLDTAVQIIEESIDLRLARGEVWEALAVARRGRAAAVPPPGTAVLQYALLPHKLAIFCETRGGVTVETVELDRNELATRIDAFDELLRRREPTDAINDSASSLYDTLIAPVSGRLQGITELVIVPDRQLYAVPFAALRAGGRYLVEQYTIRLGAASPIDPGALAPAVVIADPPFGNWPRLPASREEAARIASMHGALLLEGNDATLAAFMHAVPDSALLHYAGHADSDITLSYGALPLAYGAVLDTNSIAQLSLTRRPLVVLAACGTFRADNNHVGGMSSLAQAFLDAGARAVAGTLWEVDDDVAAPLFLRFHEQLREGAPPARALREAQLAMVHAADPRLSHPATWAPVEIIH